MTNTNSVKWPKVFLGCVLLCSLAASLVFLFAVSARCGNGWEAAASELLLVIVLAAEGLFAFYHLAESRSATQAESLRVFMHDFASEQALVQREELFTAIDWQDDFGNIPAQPVKWVLEKKGNTVRYKMKENGGSSIEVTMTSPIWRKVQRLGDQYHIAGISCQRGYMDLSDLFTWMGPQPLRWWRRFGDLILQERKRRKHPTLFKGWEYLANEAEEFDWPTLELEELG